MAGAGKFVIIAPVGPAVFLFHRIKVGVDVAIWLLGGGDFGDEGVELVVEGGVVAKRQGITGGLDPFHNIRVPEDVRFIGFARSPILIPGREAPCLFAMAGNMRDRHGTICLLSGRPKLVLERYLRKWYRRFRRNWHMV